MAKFTVMINRTRTIESSVEVELSASSEESAREKAESKIAKLQEAEVNGKPGLNTLDWDIQSDNDDFEYEVG